MAAPSALPSWYAVYCEPSREALAAAALQAGLGLAVYLPVAGRQGQDPALRAPFFPGYLFVAADLTATPPSRIRATPGVRHLLACGGAPQPVPAAAVAAIRARLDAINGAGGLPRHSFRPGDPVRLIGGPLAGLEALFVGAPGPGARVRILLEFLGRPTELVVDVATLEGARSLPAVRPARRTRGQGRPIHAGRRVMRDA